VKRPTKFSGLVIAANRRYVLPHVRLAGGCRV
jgi:hypothetical protein